MQALTLPARRGWNWFYEGFILFRKKQLLLSVLVLGYWVLMALLNSLPLVGQIAATLMIPVFSVSLMNACRLIDQGRPLPPQILFSGFDRGLRSLLMLGAVYLAVSGAIFSITSLFDDGVLFRLVALGQRPDEQALESGDAMVAVQVAMVLFVPLIMAFWYAPVLTAWHGLHPAKALFFSFVACLRNWRAFVVYALSVLMVGALIPGLVVGVLSASFAAGAGLFSSAFTILIVLVLLPTLYASFYVSYRDVFVTVDENA